MKNLDDPHAPGASTLALAAAKDAGIAAFIQAAT